MFFINDKGSYWLVNSVQYTIHGHFIDWTQVCPFVMCTELFNVLCIIPNKWSDDRIKYSLVYSLFGKNIVKMLLAGRKKLRLTFHQSGKVD